MAVRSLAACATVGLAMVAFSADALVAPAPQATVGAAGTGAGTGTGSAFGHAVGGTASGPRPGPAPEAFEADPAALVSFSRTIVRTSSQDGKYELNVAIKDMRRPPAGFLMAPLESLVPSSSFGIRTSPITGEAGEFHWGQDFAAPCGTRVYAADAGVVRAVGWHQWGGGNRVEIDHGNGLITTYNHLEAIAVQKGDSVQVGEVIARVGTTGSSTGCHLHFETILNGKHADPRDWTLLPTKQVDGLTNIEMVSYVPGRGSQHGGEAPRWAIPVSDDGTHEVHGGHTGGPDPLPASPASPAPSTNGSPSPAPGPSPTPSPTPTPSPSPTPMSPAPSPSTTTPTPTPSPTPSPLPTVTAEPTATAVPEPTATVEPSPTAEPVPAPTPEATAVPAAGPTETAEPETVEPEAAEPETAATAESGSLEAENSPVP